MAIAIAALLAAAGPAPPVGVVLYSSDAAFDIPERPTKVQPGYFVVHYMVGVHIRMTVWINLTTGQVVEPDRCLYFHGKRIQAFSASIRIPASLAPPSNTSFGHLSASRDAIGEASSAMAS